MENQKEFVIDDRSYVLCEEGDLIMMNRNSVSKIISTKNNKKTRMSKILTDWQKENTFERVKELKKKYFVSDEGQLFSATNCTFEGMKEISRSEYYKKKKFLNSL